MIAATRFIPATLLLLGLAATAPADPVASPNPPASVTPSHSFTFPEPGHFKMGEIIPYKHTAERDLRLFVEKPPGWQAADRRPAILFFFGGGWVAGSPAQFAPERTYFAARGLVAICVGYRTIPKGDSGPPAVCCADAKSAVRYVRAHAAELGIDPHRIAAAGGSAGGHLAAVTALVPGLDDPKDDLTVSCRPDALVLFNPVFDNSPGNYGHERIGARFKEFSPAQNITSNAPPAIVFFGTEDKFVPVATAKAFQAGMDHCGVRCTTIFYPGQAHGFFNQEPYRTKTLIEADKFLVSLGWLQGPPIIDSPGFTP